MSKNEYNIWLEKCKEMFPEFDVTENSNSKGKYINVAKDNDCFFAIEMDGSVSIWPEPKIKDRSADEWKFSFSSYTGMCYDLKVNSTEFLEMLSKSRAAIDKLLDAQKLHIKEVEQKMILKESL